MINTNLFFRFDGFPDVVMRTRMNLFVGASTVSFSDTTDCQNTVTMKGVGFSASEKLFVFIGSAAPVVPYSIAYGINSTTNPIVTYNDSRYPLPTTASFDDIAITGSLSSINRLEGTEPALQLTDCQVGAWRYVKSLGYMLVVLVPSSTDHTLKRQARINLDC